MKQYIGSKIVKAWPCYRLRWLGHQSFTLVNPDRHRVGSPHTASYPSGLRGLFAKQVDPETGA